MDPFLIGGGALALFAYLKNRNTAPGATAAPPSASTEAAPVNPSANRMSSGQTPPVSSEMSLDTRSQLSVQKPLQPASVWNPSGAMSQGAGSQPNDDGRVFLPAIPAQTVAPSQVGSVQDWTDLTMTDPQWIAPTVLSNPQPMPVQSVTIAAPEVAAPAPKVASASSQLPGKTPGLRAEP